MSTRSSIGILKGGKIKSIYCHWDGYIEHNGVLLEKYYKSENKIEKLLDLGDLSFLGEKLEPTGEHSFDNPEKNVTIAYGRDRGEENTQAKEYTIEEYKNMLVDSWVDYAYVYDIKEQEWLYAEIGYDYLEGVTCLSPFKRLKWKV